mgnify:CR=1 FL=1
MSNYEQICEIFPNDIISDDIIIKKNLKFLQLIFETDFNDNSIFTSSANVDINSKIIFNNVTRFFLFITKW